MSNAKRSAKLEPVTDLAVDLVVVLAEKRFAVADLVELSPGSLLELGRRHDAPLELRLGPSRLGQGRAVDLEERLGFLVEEVDAAAPGSLTAPPS